MFVGDGAGYGDEFALFNFFLECDCLFDCRESACIIVTAAAGGHHCFTAAAEKK